MRYFTDNPLERLMMEKPRAYKEDHPPFGSRCEGCKIYLERYCIPICPKRLRKSGISKAASE